MYVILYSSNVEDSLSFQLSAILNPTVQMNKNTNAAFVVIYMLSPWVAELVLAVRLAAVFPPRRTPLAKLASVFAFHVIIKSVRLGCMVTFWRFWFHETEHLPSQIEAAETIDWRDIPWTRAELFLRIFDNA